MLAAVYCADESLLRAPFFRFPGFEDGDEDRNHQYHDLKGAENEVHRLIPQVGGVTQRCHAEFSGNVHHRALPGAKKKGAKRNGGERYDPFDGQPGVFEEAPVAEQ